MLELIFLLTAFIGSAIAAVFDLKTTEIPDEIPYAMIIIALALYSIQAIFLRNYLPILHSLFWGLSLLGFGFVMYYFGQWGGGDAKILSAIGFLIPELPKNISISLMFPFPLSYSFNLFLVGAAYMLVYAFVIALIHKKVLFKFLDDMKASSRVLSIGSIILFISFIIINLFLVKYFRINFDVFFILKNSFFPLIATIALFIVWKFAKTVENVGFKKRIPVSKLKVGDVLEESKLWEGITEKELSRVKRSGKRFVVVKQGVRFAPAFPLALLFTIYIGDGLLFFMKFLI